MKLESISIKFQLKFKIPVRHSSCSGGAEMFSTTRHQPGTVHNIIVLGKAKIVSIEIRRSETRFGLVRKKNIIRDRYPDTVVDG